MLALREGEAKERLRNTDNRATWRAIEENRGLQRTRDAEAHASARSNSEERRREQSRKTADHATWRSIAESRGLERVKDAAAHRITRNNPITRIQEQRTSTVHHRNTRLQQRFREQQIQEIADERLLTYRSSSQNRNYILLQEQNFRRMNKRINGNASDGGVELRQGNNVFVTLRTVQLSFVCAVEERGFHLR